MDFHVLHDSNRDKLTCSVPDIPTDDSNLVIKVVILAVPVCMLALQLPGRNAPGTAMPVAAPPFPPDAELLSVQALKLFRERTGSQQHYKVHLQKRVPHGEQPAYACMARVLCVTPHQFIIIAQARAWGAAVVMQRRRCGQPMPCQGGQPRMRSCWNGQEPSAATSPSSSRAVPLTAPAGPARSPA